MSISSPRLSLYVVVWREDKEKIRLLEVIYMQGLTKKRPTEKLVEVRFRGTHTDVVKLRRIAQSLKVKDVTEWELEGKERYDFRPCSDSILHSDLTEQGGDLLVASRYSTITFMINPCLN